MKRIALIVALIAFAGLARATETTDMVPSSAPASRVAVGTESGTTWTGNDASNPLYCSITSGGFSSSGLATTAKQDTGNTSLGSIDTKLSSQATAANQTTTNTEIGATNETASTTDTATSGLNGRLQRIAQRITSLLTTQTDGTQLVKGIPAPCASAPLTKLYQTTASRRSMTISLGATYTWAVVTNLDTAKQVGIRLNASDTDPYIIPSGASMPTIYPAAGVANLYVDTNTSPASGGSTTYLSIYACQ